MEITLELQHVILRRKFQKIYKSRGLEHKDPFAALKVDIATYSQLGEVLIMGDFNAKTASEQAIILCCKEEYDPV